MNRSAFLAAMSTAAALLPSTSVAQQSKPDHVIRIENAGIEVAPNRYVRTTTYGGTFPGPLLRMREGHRTVVDIHNITDTPERMRRVEFVPPAATCNADSIRVRWGRSSSNRSTIQALTTAKSFSR